MGFFNLWHRRAFNEGALQTGAEKQSLHQGIARDLTINERRTPGVIERQSSTD
jgi:hypothetical protein